MLAEAKMCEKGKRWRAMGWRCGALPGGKQEPTNPKAISYIYVQIMNAVTDQWQSSTQIAERAGVAATIVTGRLLTRERHGHVELRRVGHFYQWRLGPVPFQKKKPKRELLFNAISKARLTAREAAKRVGCDPYYAQKQLRGLVKAGFAERSGPTIDDQYWAAE